MKGRANIPRGTAPRGPVVVVGIVGMAFLAGLPVGE